MITIKERDNMVQFLENYYGVHFTQLMNMNDKTLESTYEFVYNRKEMECDL